MQENWITVVDLEKQHDISRSLFYYWKHFLRMWTEAYKHGDRWLMSPLAVEFLKTRKGNIGNRGSRMEIAEEFFSEALDRDATYLDHN